MLLHAQDTNFSHLGGASAAGTAAISLLQLLPPRLLRTIKCSRHAFTSCLADFWKNRSAVASCEIEIRKECLLLATMTAGHILFWHMRKKNKINEDADSFALDMTSHPEGRSRGVRLHGASVCKIQARKRYVESLSPIPKDKKKLLIILSISK